ncbi:MAG: hypothetical protein K2M72_07555 [Paramuribaculum sp.]|nr:hypothetical protein [Paramuribaculum sp.]
MLRRLGLLSHLLLLFLSFSACKSSLPSNYASYESRVIDKEDKGFYIIRAQGGGTSLDKAAEDARRQAVYDVLFKNMHSTYGNHQMLRSVVSDPTQIEKRPKFFNNLFEEKKNYNKYIGKCDAKKEEYKSGSSFNVIMNVAVNRKELLNYMNDNEIPTNK